MTEKLFTGTLNKNQNKNKKNLLLQNRRADFHETWYVASRTPAHHSLYINDDPGVTLTYFTARSNLETKAFL